MGCVIVSPISGYVLSRSFRYYAARIVRPDGKPATSPKDIRDLDDFPIERARLVALWVVVPLFLVGTLVYGWLIDRGVHLAGPLVCQFFSMLARYRGAVQDDVPRSWLRLWSYYRHLLDADRRPDAWAIRFLHGLGEPCSMSPRCRAQPLQSIRLL
jgi:hypothetical protein